MTALQFHFFWYQIFINMQQQFSKYHDIFGLNFCITLHLHNTGYNFVRSTSFKDPHGYQLEIFKLDRKMKKKSVKISWNLASHTTSFHSSSFFVTLVFHFQLSQVELLYHPPYQQQHWGWYHSFAKQFVAEIVKNCHLLPICLDTNYVLSPCSLTSIF